MMDRPRSAPMLLSASDVRGHLLQLPEPDGSPRVGGRGGEEGMLIVAGPGPPHSELGILRSPPWLWLWPKVELVLRKAFVPGMKRDKEGVRLLLPLEKWEKASRSARARSSWYLLCFELKD
jgi:hypothetical protein